jgi:DHA1 family bicyclomycin/chloramphenicol resistance-like MFS transporter
MPAGPPASLSPSGPSPSNPSPWVGPGFAEFVGIVALMMAVTAMSIDNLLPAFPLIQERFGVADPNSLQLLVYVYMIGFGDPADQPRHLHRRLHPLDAGAEL